MIHGDLASNLIPVSLLILACVTILWCASSNSIWLRLRPTNDLPLITPLLLPSWYSSKCLSHQTHQPHMTPDNCSRELESLGAPSEKQEALKGEGQGRQKDKIYAYLCAVRSGMLTIVCVCVCVCFRISHRRICPVWTLLHQSSVRSDSKAPEINMSLFLPGVTDMSSVTSSPGDA